MGVFILGTRESETQFNLTHAKSSLEIHYLPKKMGKQIDKNGMSRLGKRRETESGIFHPFDNFALN